MYQLLIEAGGLRQIAKINAETYQRVTSEIHATAEEVGFYPRLFDGDDIFYLADGRALMEPKQVSVAIQRILERLEAQTENLLDYVLLLHNREEGKPEAAFLEMQDLLRYARQQDCAYITRSALTTMRQVVKTDDGDPLARVLAFSGDHRPSGLSYREFLLPEGEIDRCLTAVGEAEGAKVWVKSHDASAPAELIRAVAERYTEDGGALAVSILCEESMGISTLYSQIIQALPLDLSRSGSETKTIPEFLLPVFHERFYLSAGSGPVADTELGEIRVTTRHLLEGIALRVPRIVVLLEDIDRCPENVREQIDPLFADLAFEAPCVMLASAIEAPYEEGWMLFETAGATNEASADLRYAGALEYWEQIPHDRAARDPIIAPRLSRPLRGALAALRAAQDASTRRFLYLIDRNAMILHGEYFDRLFPDVGVTLAERARIVNELEHHGLVAPGALYRIHPALAGSTGVLLDAQERELIDTIMLRTIDALLDEGVLRFSPRVWELYDQIVDGSRRGERWHAYLHTLAAAGALEAFDSLPGVQSAGVRAHEVSYRSARIRLHLRDSRGPGTCAPDASRLVESVESVDLPSGHRIDALLSLGEAALAERNYGEALRFGKQAIMNRQASGESGSPAASHLLIARIMLAERRIADAGHYLNFAREEASADQGTFLIAEILDATRYFLIGNLSRADAAYASLIEPLARIGYFGWMLQAWFARARVAFELGDYRGCARLCGEMERFSQECGARPPADVARAWRIRAELLTDGLVENLIGQLHELPASAERLFVEAEYLLREGRYTRAVELLERGIEAESDADRWPRIGACWDNGFASFEDLLLANQPGSTEMVRLMSALRAWALGQEGRTEEAIETFYRLTRTGDGMSEDPYTSFYTYLYASILPEERSRDRDDRVTVLGKSVKILQERTSRIDDYRDKIRFLRHNTWNRRVMETAQRHNLA